MNILDIVNGMHIAEEPIICKDSAELFLFKNSNLKVYEELEERICHAGYKCSSRREEGEVIFSTFVHERDAIYLSYTPFEQCIRLIAKENEVFLEDSGFVGEKRVTPLITQIRNPYMWMDCGMGYVIRLSDGRFILIDGGAGEYEEADHLWDILISQYEGDEKPVIAAWFITHPHIDHFGGFVKFMDQYGKQVEVDAVLYNWALDELSRPPMGEDALTDFDRVIEEYRDKVKIITPRTGQRYVFADAIFDVLFVCEDLYPERIPDVNSTSLTMRMEFAGRKVMWLGDLTCQAAEYISKRFPTETFRCEIYQVAHHGYYGATDELHRKMDPEVLLWPCPNFWFPVIRLWNDYLIHSPKVRATIVSGQGEVVLDMTKPIEPVNPYVLSKDCPIVYEERFEGDRVMDLHWSCITGGSTGYRPAHVTLEQNSCRLKSIAEDAYTVCEFVQPGLMELAKDYTLTVSGKIEEGTEQFGLFWNYPTPTIFSEEHVLWLTPEENGNFTFHLKANWKEKKAQLYLYDKLVCELPYETCGGLYFILKNADVQLHHIQVTHTP